MEKGNYYMLGEAVYYSIPDEALTAICSRINSGRFTVPWELTAAILDELGAEMVVYDPIDQKTK
jgi:hypothetical protein